MTSAEEDANHQIILGLSDKAKEIAISCTYNVKTAHVAYLLNHKYDRKAVMSPIGKDWSKNHKTLEDMLIRKRIEENDVTTLLDNMDDNYNKIVEAYASAQNENGGAGGKVKKSKTKQHYVQKYRGNDFLSEAVIIEGKPHFAIARDKGDSITLESSIEVNGEIFLPPIQRMYLNRPYIFESKEEFDNFAEVAKNESLDSLYTKVKSQWQKYDATDDDEISLCSADCIFTFYQDILGMTHYLFFAGPPDSGKSNKLLIFNFAVGTDGTDGTDSVGLGAYISAPDNEEFEGLDECEGTITSKSEGSPSDNAFQASQASQNQNKDIVFWSRLTELAYERGGIFKGSELQDRLVSTPAWTDTSFLIENSLQKGEIEAIEGQFDTYRIVRRGCDSKE